MNSRQAITAAMDISRMVLKQYVSDLTDAELLKRPGEGCNHVAWQLGHLIDSECGLLNSLVPGAAPALPDGFKEKHSKANCGSDNPQDFCTKEKYLELLDQVHAASVQALNAVTEEDLDQPSPENLRSWFPTAGQVWVLMATHPLMHAGQFVPLRRALGKPIVI